MSRKNSSGSNVFSIKTFLQSAGVLMGGTALAQILLLLALPLITRIYSPADFGVLAVFTATIAVLVIVSSLRLEISLSLPKSDQEAAIRLC